jgi:hypothetical protein
MANATFDGWIAKARAVPIEREIERRGISLRGNGRDRAGPCPVCGGDDRFSISTAKQVFNCRGCGIGGDVIALVEHLDKVDFKAACTTLTGEPPPQRNGGANGKGSRAAEAKKVVVAEFEYQNADGIPVFVVERVEYQNANGGAVVEDGGKRKKTFRQKRPDPDRSGRWLWNVDGVPSLPYRLPELLEAIALDCTVLIVEGEAKADHLLQSWNIPATCCAGGAKKWRAEHAEYLRGANVVILPDNDDVGREHMNVVATSLQDIAASIRVLFLPDLSDKGDIIDWAANGGTVEQLHNLIENSPHWLPPLETDSAADTVKSSDKTQAEQKEDKLLEALARLRPGVEFARQRKKAAKELGVRASDIDAEIEARRSEKAVAPLYGHWITEPWPEVADGDSLVRDIVRRILSHVVCAHDDALAAALWIMFAWIHDTVTHSPLLLVTSAQPECGKSTALGLVKFLAPRCVASVEISEAALFRAIQLWQPSFAIDEFDSVLAGDDRTGLRSVINSGHTRGQGVIRCIEPDFTPQQFETFCPKAIGMVGRKLPDATLSRCIVIELRRRKADERVIRFTHRDDAELAPAG